jgi:hypothetical protein
MNPREETMNDRATTFNQYWASLPEAVIEQMMRTSREEEAKRIELYPDLAVPPVMVPCEALETLRRHVIRERIQEFWDARKQARRESERQFREAIAGRIGSDGDERQAIANLAMKLRKRDPDDHLAALAEQVPGQWQHSGHTGPCRYLLYDAACQLRAVGRLDEAYACIRRSLNHWVVAPDDPLPLPPRMARFAVPTLIWGRCDFEGNRAVFVQYVTPWVDEFNWARADHVIGLGTTITHEVLDRVGVPRFKQHILEVHRQDLAPVGASFPRLRGRVIVVDDVHEGETALGVARLYRGDVVNTEPNQICSLLFDAPQALASICEPPNLWLHYKDSEFFERAKLARQVDQEFISAGRKAMCIRRPNGSRPLRAA